MKGGEFSSNKTRYSLHLPYNIFTRYKAMSPNQETGSARQPITQFNYIVYHNWGDLG